MGFPMVFLWVFLWFYDLWHGFTYRYRKGHGALAIRLPRRQESAEKFRLEAQVADFGGRILQDHWGAVDLASGDD